MNQSLRFCQVLPKFRFCGNFMNGSKCRESRILPVRTYMARIGDKTLANLKARDTIPEDFHLVYKGDMDTYMYAASTTAWAGLVAALGGFCRYVLQDRSLSFPTKQPDVILMEVENYTQLGIVCCFSVCMLTLMHKISTQYVLRMYYNSSTKTYRAIRMGILPTNIKSHDFLAGTLKRIEKTYYVPWWNDQYTSDNVKMLLFEHCFKTPDDFHRMFQQ